MIRKLSLVENPADSFLLLFAVCLVAIMVLRGSRQTQVSNGKTPSTKSVEASPSQIESHKISRLKCGSSPGR